MAFINEIDIRCQVCLTKYSSKDPILQGLRACPHCGTVLPPQKISEDGYAFLNWQDLRVLAIYAKRWSQIFDLRLPTDRDALKALDNIIAKISKFQPKEGQPIHIPGEQVIVQRMPEIPKSQIPVPGALKSPFYQPKGQPPLQEEQ